MFKSKWALKDISFNLPKGRCLVLYGPSGCGKTTMLRLTAGFEKPDEGKIWINSRLVSAAQRLVRPYDRNVGMVFQDLALWPHMTVEEQLTFVLSARVRSKAEQETATRAALDQVGLNVGPDKYPHQLSGGEKQRLALARALIGKPEILLMDEPLSNLDSILKKKILQEIKKIIQTAGTTTIYVTHDLQEALFMADLLAVMDNGKIRSLDTVDAYGVNRIKKNEMVCHGTDNCCELSFGRAGL